MTIMEDSLIVRRHTWLWKFMYKVSWPRN